MAYEQVLTALFFLLFGAMLHTYIFYPISLRLMRPRFPVPKDLPDPDLPRVAVLIPAHNEESVIEQKLRNTLEQDYPPELSEILVGSDGSTDRTCDVVRSFPDPRIRLIELSGRNGKATVINRLATETDAAILVSTDANALLTPNALRKLVRHFADPAVGVVSGGKHIRISSGAEAVRGESTYSDFENRLKTMESGLGGVSGCRGALVACRHRDFIPYPSGTINDDLIIGMAMALTGKRVVFDPEACATEDSAGNVADEFRRRVRIGSGYRQAIRWYWQILDPRRGMVAYTFFSHKVIRWMFPFLMIGTLLCSALLFHRPFFRLCMLGQIAFYGAAGIGGIATAIRRPLPLFSGLFHFSALNTALLVGLLHSHRANPSGVWDRTPRRAPV